MPVLISARLPITTDPEFRSLTPPLSARGRKAVEDQRRLLELGRSTGQVPPVLCDPDAGRKITVPVEPEALLATLRRRLEPSVLARFQELVGKTATLDE
jgi:hypothetical protein